MFPLLAFGRNFSTLHSGIQYSHCVLSCILHILCAVYRVHTAYFTVVVVVLYSKHSRLLITALNGSLLLIWVWLRWSGLKALTCIVLHDQLHAWCVNLCLSLHFPFTGIIHFSLHAFLGKRPWRDVALFPIYLLIRLPFIVIAFCLSAFTLMSLSHEKFVCRLLSLAWKWRFHVNAAKLCNYY